MSAFNDTSSADSGHFGGNRSTSSVSVVGKTAFKIGDYYKKRGKVGIRQFIEKFTTDKRTVTV